MQQFLAGEGKYVALLLAIFVLPRVLQRWRIPAAITALGLGALAGPGLGWFAHDPTVGLLSTLGIVTLFLFAGLDVELSELARERGMLIEHLAIRALSIATVAAAAVVFTGVSARGSVIVALALLTPSAGFILESLGGLGLEADARFWIRSKAIASELFALTAMFVTLQSETLARLGLSSVLLLSLILFVPLIVRGFARVVAPYAPKSEFSFLVILAVMCAMATRKMGVYYLVGAFIVGVAAQRLREKLPAMASERMVHAVESIASLFIPFYFFHAGLSLRREDLGIPALQFGGLLLAVFVPLRVLEVNLHRRIRLGEGFRASSHVSVPLLPTLVFTLVLAQILREHFDAPVWLFGGLVYYAIGNTLLPSMVFRAPVPSFESLDVDEEERAGVLG